MRHCGMVTCVALAALTYAGMRAQAQRAEGEPYWIHLPGKGPLLVMDGEVMVVHTGPAVSDPDAPRDAKDLKKRNVTTDLFRVSEGTRQTIKADSGDAG